MKGGEDQTGVLLAGRKARASQEREEERKTRVLRRRQVFCLHDQIDLGVWECDLMPPIGVIDLSREPSHKDTWLDGHWADLGPPSRIRRLRREVRACLRIGSRFKPREKRRVRAFLSGQLCVSKQFLIELK